MDSPPDRNTGDAPRLGKLRDVARDLFRGGRSADALALLEHLETLGPDDCETLRLLARALQAEGQPLKAIHKLIALREIAADPEMLVAEIRLAVPVAAEEFNDHLAAGRIAEAEKCAAALAALLPGNSAFLNSALSCNVALGRKADAARYAAALLGLEPAHAAARAALLDSDGPEIIEENALDQKITAAMCDGSAIHPLLRLRDIHDLIGLLLCRELSERSVTQIRQLQQAARAIEVGAPAGSEWEGWAKHYRLAIEATDLTAALAPTPPAQKEAEIVFATSSGETVGWHDVRTAAGKLGAEVVFFAAADASYVDLYARWYINSILEHCDVPCLIVLHVIGGARTLRETVKSVGIASEKVIFAGDSFDPERVTTKCYDTPPKRLIARPVAHYQSVRFKVLGPLLRNLGFPVFVSDIDLLLQRGVLDLLQRCADADVVLNENTYSTSAGARFTANLLLVNPTHNADVFARFVGSYLEAALSEAEVSRWIDQFALMQARHHLSRWGNAPRIEFFDTSSDVNNVMYRTYQSHPFRFLSLYHGFDMSSLGAERVPDRREAAATG